MQAMLFFNKPNVRRLSQVSSQRVCGILMQTQGGSNYCGLCVVNNLIGPDVNNVFPVSVQEIDSIADRMWLNFALDPSVTIHTEIPALRDIEGYYSIEVLTQILEDYGYSLVRLDPNIIDSIDD